MRQIEALSAISKSSSRRGSLRFGLVFAVFLFGAGFGAFAYRVATNSSVSATVAPQTESGPQLIRRGTRIVIAEASPLRSDLTIDVIGQKEIERNLVLPAAVEADPARLVKVLPPLSGRVMQLKVQLGEQVEQGDPLLVFDSPDLLTAFADYDRAKVVLALALKNRDRLRQLARTGGAASKDQQQAETDYVTAEVEQQRTESRLKQIGVDPETTNKSRTVTIAAPISGSVIDLAAAPGAYWNDTTAPLMTVADLSSIWVTANVPEKDTSLVSKGQNADVVLAAYPRETLKGQVLFVSNVLDPDTRRTKVRIAFQNQGARLKPGMFANVTFFAPKQMVPIVPTTALVLKDDVNQVFVEVAPWTFEARPVEVGFQQGDLAVIQSGVKVGDRAVMKGGVLLND